ncbi:MAG: hypothetical protein SFT93_02950 [Rickettsiaceae bacterium]|nr:hypothetical protein [Rickettsiaceae bacterium]
MTYSSALTKAFTANSNVDMIRKINQQRSDATKKTTSRLKYENYGKMAASPEMNLRSRSIKDSQKFSNISQSLSITKNKLDQDTNLMQTFRDIAIDLISQIKQFNSLTSYVTFQQCADSLLKMVAARLNQKNNSGGFIYGGATNNIAPIEDINSFVSKSNILKVKDQEFATANYTKVIPYEGEESIGFSEKINSNINAAHPAFQKFIAGIHKVKQMSSFADKTNRLAAINFLEQAINEFNLLIESIANKLQYIAKAEKYNSGRYGAAIDTLDSLQYGPAEMVEENERLTEALQAAVYSMSNQKKQSDILSSSLYSM